MRTLPELRRWAATKYRRNHRVWISDPDVDVSFPLGLPTEQEALADPDALAAWRRSWHQWHPPEGAALEWAVRSWPSWGSQRLPLRVRVTSAEGIAGLAGQQSAWARCRQLAGIVTSRWPESSSLADSLPHLVDDIAGLDDADVERLMAMADWLIDHPDSGLLPRQVAVHGIDTKWLEKHRGLVERLILAITGQEGIGLASEPQRFRIRVLDVSVSGTTLHDLTTGVDELDRLVVSPRVVLIVENLTTLAALPPVPGVIAVHGRGYAVVQLDRVHWIRDSPILYWGDLDTHGFAILSRCRARMPQTRSVLMTRALVSRFEELAVPEPGQAHGVSGLTDEEREVFLDLERRGLRLEQERIPMDLAAQVLNRALLEI
ncbi:MULTISPECIES: Wadjet anti-phage system protein JetD domain-containing protein [Acidipropionibacterium]|uniref:Wadjet anti-phage system protein JetD domain-containing protein n=1 Tax=Acidipropionibacterium TaxID=1912215 RepID=UPI00041ADB1D|nr:Wadjet anti-phage system protein JetD domain-containing protein [Acidipropionibacterium thoenii]